MPESDKKTNIIEEYQRFFIIIARLMPFLIVFFFVIIAIFNNKVINSLTYIVGVLLVSGIVNLLANIVQKPNMSSKNIAFPFKNIKYTLPYVNSSITAFTISYILIPTLFNSKFGGKYILGTIFLTIIHIVNSVCENNIGIDLESITVGTILGIFLGLIYYFIISNLNRKLVYFTDINSRSQCSKEDSTKVSVCEFVEAEGELNTVSNVNTQFTALEIDGNKLT
tara:strand:- start:5267 stop:5938 length:672 start_codon:yes stop_codon:yes gene_type:complete